MPGAASVGRCVEAGAVGGVDSLKGEAGGGSVEVDRHKVYPRESKKRYLPSVSADGGIGGPVGRRQRKLVGMPRVPAIGAVEKQLGEGAEATVAATHPAGGGA